MRSKEGDGSSQRVQDLVVLDTVEYRVAWNLPILSIETSSMLHWRLLAANLAPLSDVFEMVLVNFSLK